jgi:hypothetical protein
MKEEEEEEGREAMKRIHKRSGTMCRMNNLIQLEKRLLSPKLMSNFSQT